MLIHPLDSQPFDPEDFVVLRVKDDMSGYLVYLPERPPVEVVGEEARKLSAWLIKKTGGQDGNNTSRFRQRGRIL